MKIKTTKLEKSWILYDIANSSYTLLITSILPIYFNGIATAGGLDKAEYFAYWSYAASITTLIVALTGPILATFADRKDTKKWIFLASVVLGVGFSLALGFVSYWLAFLALFVVGKVGYSYSLIFYDSMLPDITTQERMDEVSSFGFAYGYIGSCIPFVISLVGILFADKIGITASQAVQIAIFINVGWWILLSLPLFRNYKQINYLVHTGNPFIGSFRELGATLKEIFRDKHVFFFLLAYLFYIDGVYTIIAMSTAYGGAVGLDSNGLLLALLTTQIVAFPSAIFLGKLASKFRTRNMIMVCITAYFGISVFAIFLDTTMDFWILAVCVGLFQGTIQALSRSYFAKIISPENSSKYFSFLDICGKGASVIGMFSMGLITDLTGDVSLGVVVLSVMFVIGFILFKIASSYEEK